MNGFSLKDANDEQMAFLNEIAHDPSKGNKWLILMDIVLICLGDVVEAKKAVEANPVLIRFFIRSMAIKATNATDKLFPFDRKSDSDVNPVAPALRMDVVKFLHLGGILDGVWDEAESGMKQL